ncbi:MAG: hypothetical protein RBR06_04620 [Desulfuromonadaceae bacterium]|nr:hypothetical protein [Desulfuromonadaceae bacterium]
MTQNKGAKIIRTILALIAFLFGLATIFAGGRVLMGFNPGYVVFRPLLIYNTAMGVAYLGVGSVLWRSLVRGRYAAGAIFLLNLLVLVAVVLLYCSGGPVAVDSLQAMSFRTVVWLGLFLAASWLLRSKHCLIKVRS